MLMKMHKYRVEWHKKQPHVFSEEKVIQSAKAYVKKHMVESKK